MKILTLGTGPSTQNFIDCKLKLKSDISTLTFHRAFPYFLKNSNTHYTIDYWTWADPDAALDGLNYYNRLQLNELYKLPKIIIPFWLLNIELFNKYSGTSRINLNPNGISLYNSTLKKLNDANQLIIIKNANSTKNIKTDHEIFSNISTRFNSTIYFGSVPCDGIHSSTNWANENKFTNSVLPTCIYLKSTDVYCLGFDNCGNGINRTNSPVTSNERILQKFKLWIDWTPYHKMNIYSVIKDSPNNSILTYKPIEHLCIK
jgi:hypothetical protein